ncbi:MAG: hypothetical protein GDA51_06420 [Ekhidna sp.]|nr:hypothetical protein [Ekhidna sp.]
MQIQNKTEIALPKVLKVINAANWAAIKVKTSIDKQMINDTIFLIFTYNFNNYED